MLIFRWIELFSHFYISTSIHYIVKNWHDESLIFGRKKKCSSILITTSDAFILKHSLKQLMDLKAVVVSPLLNAPFGSFSNVYNLLGEDFVYRQKIGFIKVNILNKLKNF